MMPFMGSYLALGFGFWELGMGVKRSPRSFGAQGVGVHGLGLHGQAQGLADFLEHLGNGAGGVHAVEDVDALEEREHRFGLGVVVVDALADGLGMIVRALQQLASAHVADALHLGTVADEVVVQAALGA